MRWLIKTACATEGLVVDEINTLGYKQRVTWISNCLAIIPTSEDEIKRIGSSSAVAKLILKKPIVLQKNEILKIIKEKQFPRTLLQKEDVPEGATFVVRHEHLGTVNPKLPTEKIERELGAEILSKRNDLNVDLKNPKLQFYVITWNSGSVMGWLYKKLSFAKIASRAPKKGPYFRGGGMKPRLCRLMVNLLYPLSGIVLDPFCGHGGLLREIADLGSFGVGIEVNKKLCRELLANNRHFGYSDAIAIIMGDATKSPLRNYAYDQAITDPPYAIQTTTKGLDREDLMIKWLQSQKKGLKLVFTTPKLMLNNLPLNWVVSVDQLDFVHKSLTRRIRRVIST